MRVSRKTTIEEQDEPMQSAEQPAAERVIYLILSVVELLLALRIMLSLFGANRGNGFAQFIYSVTYPMVAPFFGLFGSTFEYGVSRLEIETLVAMIVYALVGWVIMSVVSIGRRA